MDFRNYALNIFSHNDPTIISGVPSEVHEKLIVELARTKGDLEATVKLVSGFLQVMTGKESRQNNLLQPSSSRQLIGRRRGSAWARSAFPIRTSRRLPT